ncbi:hypothetical protein D3C72_1543270 [compost metagenome]
MPHRFDLMADSCYYRARIDTAGSLPIILRLDIALFAHCHTHSPLKLTQIHPRNVTNGSYAHAIEIFAHPAGHHKHFMYRQRPELFRQIVVPEPENTAFPLLRKVVCHLGKYFCRSDPYPGPDTGGQHDMLLDAANDFLRSSSKKGQ